MKMLKPLSSILLLGLAVTVTVGSMYVTVSAAARQNELAQDAVPEPAAAGFDEIVPIPDSPDIEPEMVAPVPAVPVVETLTPEEIRSDRQHHISLDANGGFSGTLSAFGQNGGELTPAESMQVRLIRDGSVIGSTMSGADGSFSFSGLEEGVIALLAFSDNGFLLYGVRLVNEQNVFADESDAGAATLVNFVPETSVQLTVSSAIVSGPDVQIARDLIFGELPQGDTRFTGEAAEKENTFQYGNGQAGTEVVHHAVQLQGDGSVKGHINLLDPRTGRHREITDLTLHFIRSGELRASTQIQRNGDFEVMGLNPGVHSVVATGADGTLAVGVDIIGSEVARTGPESKYKLTSVSQTAEFSACPANSRNFNVNNADNVSDGVGRTSGGGGGAGAPVGSAAPFGPGGGPMGGAPGGGVGSGLGGGGGGIGGGGSGLGALLAAAAAGAIGYAIGEDQASPNR